MNKLLCASALATVSAMPITSWAQNAAQYFNGLSDNFMREVMKQEMQQQTKVDLIGTWNLSFGEAQGTIEITGDALAGVYTGHAVMHNGVDTLNENFRITANGTSFDFQGSNITHGYYLDHFSNVTPMGTDGNRLAGTGTNAGGGDPITFTKQCGTGMGVMA
jgi:hypothetical protein